MGSTASKEILRVDGSCALVATENHIRRGSSPTDGQGSE